MSVSYVANSSWEIFDLHLHIFPLKMLNGNWRQPFCARSETKPLNEHKCSPAPHSNMN